jgi:hypothetical protein
VCVILEYYSAIKKNEIMSLAGNGWNWEIIMLSKTSETQKVKYYIFYLIYKILKKKRDMNVEGNMRE